MVNTGNPPELFQPDIPVVVVGHFSAGLVRLGPDLVSIVDHTAKYVQDAPNGTKRWVDGPPAERAGPTR